MNKKLIIIAAISKNGVYGKDDNLPWKIKEDMEHFQRETIGSTVVMGRETWNSLPVKYRPLRERANFILSSNAQYEAPAGTQKFTSLSEALMAAETEKVFAIGGRQVWVSALPFADQLVITHVNLDIPQSGMTSYCPELLDLERFGYDHYVMCRKVCLDQISGKEIEVVWERYTRL